MRLVFLHMQLYHYVCGIHWICFICEMNWLNWRERKKWIHIYEIYRNWKTYDIMNALKLWEVYSLNFTRQSIIYISKNAFFLSSDMWVNWFQWNYFTETLILMCLFISLNRCCIFHLIRWKQHVEIFIEALNLEMIFNCYVSIISL